MPNTLPRWESGGSIGDPNCLLLNADGIPWQVGRLFAVALALRLRRSEKASILRFVGMLLMVTLAWLVAVNVAYQIDLRLDRSSPAHQFASEPGDGNAAAPDGNVDAETRQREIRESEKIDFGFNAYNTAVWLLGGGVPRFVALLRRRSYRDAASRSLEYSPADRVRRWDTRVGFLLCERLRERTELRSALCHVAAAPGYGLSGRCAETGNASQHPASVQKTSSPHLPKRTRSPVCSSFW